MSHTGSQSGLGTLALISLESWDDVWRRNQHLASRLPSLGYVDHVIFVNPARSSRSPEYSPVPGVTVVSPRRRIPKRLGGLRAVALSLRLRVTRHCDALWINDPDTGVWLSRHRRAIYDVTDDWRFARATPREVRRLIAAEDLLAKRARTIVCSQELQRRWKSRYGVDAVVVRNGADVAAINAAKPCHLGSDGPHIGYVGTLHQSRIDIDLVLRTAEMMRGGTLHLVGPDSLTDAGRSRLRANPRIMLHGSVPASEVPNWLVAFDVLICPHVVTEFTRSLDAIKAYEYLATTNPVVATPTSGFQEMTMTGLYVVEKNEFPSAVLRALQRKESFRREVPDWDDQARRFATALADLASDSSSIRHS
jgi:teichuronic acid biosynthesis glycosyltransferase TuaH